MLLYCRKPEEREGGRPFVCVTLNVYGLIKLRSCIGQSSMIQCRTEMHAKGNYKNALLC